MGPYSADAFAAFTFVVIIAVIFICRDLMTTFFVVGLLTNFLILSSQLYLYGSRAEGVAATGFAGRPAERFVGVPPDSYLGGAHDADVVGEAGDAAGRDLGRPAPGAARADEDYFGAIDLSDEAFALGLADWKAAARDDAPEGNPFSAGRVAPPQAAPPCVDDDAVNVLDADELNTVHARARNDETLVWAGVRERKTVVDGAVREELDERENTYWWGVHEI